VVEHERAERTAAQRTAVRDITVYDSYEKTGQADSQYCGMSEWTLRCASKHSQRK